MPRALCVFLCVAVACALAAAAEESRKVVIADCEVLSIGDFERDLDGFKGTKATRDVTQAKTGKASLKIEVDFSKAGKTAWTTVGRPLTVPKELKQLRFWIRSAEAKGISIRLNDRTGQSHQQRPSFEPNGDWQLVKIGKFDGGPGYQKYGGANDGKFHWPAQNIDFIVERGVLGGQDRGTIWIDGVEALADRKPFIPDLELNQARLGNIFVAGEKVQIPVRSSAERIAWTVEDFFHAKVAQGATAVQDGNALIEPDVKGKGYFEVHLVAQREGAVLAEGTTAVAVVAPVDIGKMKDSPFGVMTHFAQGWDIDIIPLIAKAGIRSVRDELYWQQVEKKPGEYDFTKFDAYMSELAKHGIDPLIAMTFANKLYDDGNTPWTAAGCQGYANYGEAILKKYGKQIQWLEIWNEYNGTWCKGTAATDRPKYYAQMLKYAYEKIKAVRPDVQVLGGAAVLIPLPYFDGIFKHGGLDWMDAAVVHPYRGEPEGVEEEVAALKELMTKCRYGGPKPVWVTETGSHDKSPEGRHNVARYLVRMYTLLRSENVERIYWYLTRDYQSFTTMGLLRGEKDPMGRYAPAPAYAAYSNLIQQLHEARFIRREATDPRTRIYLFDRAGQAGLPADRQVRVCWSTAPSHVALRAGAPLTVVDMMGREQTLEPFDGEVCLTLNLNPVYVKGAVDKVLPAGRFIVPPEQVTDVQGEVRLQFELDNAGSSQPLEGTLEVLDRKAELRCAPGARQKGALVIPHQDTHQSDSRIYWYRLILGGKVAGLGGVTVHVADPLAFGPDARTNNDGTVEMRLANSSSTTAYEANAVAWEIGDAKQARALDVKLPAGSELLLRLPDANLAPYHAYPAKVTVGFNGRTPLTFVGEICDSPFPKREPGPANVGELRSPSPISLLADGHWRLGAPKSGENAGGNAWFIWDEDNLHLLYLSARTADTKPAPARLEDFWAGDSISFAVAPARFDRPPAPGTTPWHEFRMGLTAKGPQLYRAIGPEGTALGPMKDAGTKINRSGDDTLYEVAVPWSQLAPMKPNDGALRLSLLVCYDGGGGLRTVEWGRGIGFGKDPSAFRLCRLMGGAAGASATTVPFAEVRKLDQVLKPPAEGKVIADSTEDYTNIQGKGNWHYGYYAGDGKGKGNGVSPAGPYTDDDFQEMKYVQTVWGYEWAGPLRYLKLTRTGGHPEKAEGRPVWAVRRWKSTVGGTARITGTVSSGNAPQGDGICGYILVDGVVVFDVHVGGKDRPKSADYDVQAGVREGSLVDFAITPGPAASLDFDAAGFTARISAQ